VGFGGVWFGFIFLLWGKVRSGKVRCGVVWELSPVAQQVVQGAVNAKVIGSNPVRRAFAVRLGLEGLGGVRSGVVRLGLGITIS
jgi:hypothetical protein